ncbi:MAG: CCA tRNA nucleotidyltransferase [Phycisphaerales bacterium]|nr:CCA tRNA nucleotidyltransferase [Phycisphaerales bacterium]
MSGADAPARAREAATSVVRALRAAGHQAFFAGGCVRDELLGLHPKDFDVATSATPDRVRALFPGVQEVGAAFGVMIVRAQSVSIEVATFRADGVYSDRRRPDEVQFADSRADASRRDFTINALFLDPLEPDPARRIVDHVGGLTDLRAGVVRAVGDPEARLAEDHLRALRAVRFSARLGFTIEESTSDAIRAHARDLAGVSRERIGEELRRMFAHPARAVAAWTLQYLGLDAPVLETTPSLRAPHRLARLRDDAPFGVALAAWAIDRAVDPPGGGEIGALCTGYRRALCLSNEDRDTMRDVLEGFSAVIRQFWWWGPAKQKRLAARCGFSDVLRILGAQSAEEFVRIVHRVEELRRTPSGIDPTPYITGDDLVGMGFRPGPAFKGLLDDLYDAQLEDRVPDKASAEALARELAADRGVSRED